MDNRDDKQEKQKLITECSIRLKFQLNISGIRVRRIVLPWVAYKHTFMRMGDTVLILDSNFRNCQKYVT